MAALDVAAVAGRIVFDQLHVGEQTRSCMAAFEQVVAENFVFREARAKRFFERIYFVDALTDERSLTEQVLVNVRRSSRVGINPRFAAAQPLIE